METQQINQTKCVEDFASFHSFNTQTRLLATGVESYLSDADLVVVMEGGGVLASGGVLDLITGATPAAAFLKGNILNPTLVGPERPAAAADEEEEQDSDQDSCE